MPFSLSKNKTPFPGDDNEKLNLVYQCLAKNNQSHRPLQYITEYFDWTLQELDEIKLKYLLDNSEHLEIMSLGNLGHNAYKLKVASYLKIIEHGSFSAWQDHLDNKDDFKIKHRILGLLIGNADNYFWAKDLYPQLSISFDNLHYLSDEMKSEGSVIYMDASSKEGVDFALKISPKGKGIFLKKEYLNPKSNLTPFIQMIDNSVTNSTSGDGSPILTDKSSIKDSYNENAESNESIELSKTANRISKTTLIWTVIGIIVAIVLTILTIRYTGQS